MPFEHQTRPLLSPRRFAERLFGFLFIGAIADGVVVSLGALGFRLTAEVDWLDAFVDAALVVTGNGPRHIAHTDGGKLFLIVYALGGGTIFIVVVALVLAPALHRLLHLFHLRTPDEEQ